MSVVRPVSGLDRPIIQWTFVLFGAVLIAISASTGVALTRARRAIATTRAEAEQARIERDRLDEALTRERAARESFMLQLGRERHAADAAPPTLTLTPVTSRSARGPELAVPSPRAPLVQLRLMLPPRTALDRPFSITLRSWTTGEVLWSRGSIRASEANAKPAVLATIASDVLLPGPYELLLTAGTPAAEVAGYEVSIVPSSDAR